MDIISCTDPAIVRAEVVRQLEAWRPVRDNALLAFPISEVIREKPELIEQYLDGKESLVNYYIGQVYKRANKKRTPDNGHTTSR